MIVRVLSGGRSRPGLREVWPELLIMAALLSFTLLLVLVVLWLT
jgi:hypothetical protein